MTITPVTTKIVQVPHLGGIDASTYMPHPYDPSKPTLVLCNSFGTSADLYRHQYQNAELNKLVNLLAIELLGHGQTRAKTENFTYWDSAIMNLQVLDKLEIKDKVFVLGTSQGGWQTVRMALLAPERVAGIIPLGTSMDTENERTVRLGCWDAKQSLTPIIDGWTTNETTPDFIPPEEFCHFMNASGFGKDIPTEDGEFWVKAIQKNWGGDDGRRRARMCATNLRDRDGLHGRLFDVRVPVLWLHGDQDVVYSVANAEEEIKLFVNSPDATLQVIKGGPHYLNYTKAREVDAAVVSFLTRYVNQAKL
ncbi:alpha/beta hydrolase fold family protein [Aureobasidium sp. EXF-10728]|nr:alpha/beta hydrolase fold family protein [Aureobasidium sp. EXF-10728]